MADWFETWFDTEYYHTLYRNRSYAEADGFVEKLFQAGIVRAEMRILELACGKGRHAIAMHRMGATVVGVDLSAHSIEAAKASEVPGLSFSVHDMRNPLPHELHSFDAVTNLFTSFAYFADERENEQVLRNVAAMLKPGGVFVLDFMNVGPVLQNLIPNHYLEVDGIKFNITKKYEEGKIIKTIHVDDHGKTAGPFFERVQAFPPERLAAFAQEAGLEVVNIYGSYQLDPLDTATSARCILVCRASMV